MGDAAQDGTSMVAKAKVRLGVDGLLAAEDRVSSSAGQQGVDKVCSVSLVNCGIGLAICYFQSWQAVLVLARLRRRGGAGRSGTDRGETDRGYRMQLEQQR